MWFSVWADQGSLALIHLDRAVHFQTTTGDDALIGPGDAEISSLANSLLQIQVAGKEPFFVDAQPIQHKQPIEQSMARAVPDEANPDLIHLMLLLKEGNGLEAVGSLSGVQTRGGKSSWQPAIELFTDFTSTSSTQSFMLQPDRQAVMGRLKQEKTTKSMRLITMNVNLFQSDIVGLPLSPDFKVRAAKKQVRSGNGGRFIWSGNLIEQPGSARFVVRGQNVTGVIRSGKSLYSIQPLGDGVHALVELDQSQFPLPMAQSLGYKKYMVPRLAVLPTAPVTIDILAAYTRRALDLMAGANDTEKINNLQDRVELSAAGINQSFMNSIIPAQIRIVGYQPVTYNEGSKTAENILDDVTGMTDGSMDEIHKVRLESKADVVILFYDVVNFATTNEGGIAWLLPPKENAFGTVNLRFESATHLGTAHELGHILGGDHDIDSKPLTTIPWAHGTRIPGKWHTIMSYPCPSGTPCNTTIENYSNPAVLNEGIATGDPTTRDNARVIREQVANVGLFSDYLAMAANPPIFHAHLWHDDNDGNNLFEQRNFQYQCGTGTYSGKMGLSDTEAAGWAGPIKIAADDGWGGCQQKFGILDPGNFLTGLQITMTFGQEPGTNPGECQYGWPNVYNVPGSITYSIPIGQNLSFSPPIRWNMDAPQGPGGCFQQFDVSGRDDIGLDIKFYVAPGNSIPAQCKAPWVGWRTASKDNPVRMTLDTVNRMTYGCMQEFRLRKIK